jgi:RND family efflux transporter MFP subunit
MNRKILVVIIGMIIIGGGYIAYAQFKGEEKERKQTPGTKKVQVVEVGKGVENGVITRQGVVKGDKEVYLSAKAEGRVQNLYKEVGEKVYRGQLLARIDGREYWAQSRVAQTGYESADKGVSKTKKFFEAQIKQAKKARDLAKEAYEGLKESGDPEKIAEAKANYEMAKKAVKTAERGYDLQVRMAKGQRDVAEQQWQAANTVAGNTNLTAPFSGVIAQKMVEVGDLVGPQRPLLLLVDDSKKEVEVSVEGEYLQGIKVGEEIIVIAKNGKKYSAKVKAVSPMIDTHSRKGIIKISLPADEAFVLGEYVSVLIPQPEKMTGGEVLIPQEAIVRIYHDTFVFVVKDGQAKKVKVKTGEIVGNKIIIQEGLSGGEKLVVKGQQYLKDGEKVEF